MEIEQKEQDSFEEKKELQGPPSEQIVQDPASFGEKAEVRPRRKGEQHLPKKESVLPEEFLQKLASLGTVEEKLEHLLVFMQHALEIGGGHHFREFWDARKLCADLFTQDMHPSMRVRLWAQYTDICHEARLFREWFEEQSSFLSEQIEQAIGAVEAELPLFEEKGNHLPSLPELAACEAIKRHLERYEHLHHELQYLNSFASRIASLRKELLKTEMRYKSRHKLLERLSKLGDAVFPKRKQAISEVSALFLEDVEEFIRSTPCNEMRSHALFEVREEIKQLQEIAKILTLSTDAFSKTREHLSECWEAIKNILKEQKKAEHEKKELFRKSRDELFEEIKKVEKDVEEKKISSFDAKKALHDLSLKMRDVPLAHQDVRLLREMLQEAEKGVYEQAAQESKNLGKKEEKDRAIKYQSFIERLKNALEDKTFEGKEEALQNLSSEMQELRLPREEKWEAEKELARLRGEILDLGIQQASKEISQEVLLALEHLRAECKRHIDTWRKQTSGSQCDFSLAIQYTDLIEEEKERIVRIEEAIEKLK